MTKTTAVIYHKSDWDGLFCYRIARKALGDENVEYIGWEYGESEPVIDRACTLYILDLSVPSLMDRLNLTWCDHHKSALEKYGPRTGLQIDGVAACRLAWQWFFPSDPEETLTKQLYWDRQVSEPSAVRLAGEYDVFDHRDPDAITFQFGLNAAELSDGDWATLLSENKAADVLVQQLLVNGRTARRYQERMDAGLVSNRSFTWRFEGLNFLCLNTARCNSLTFAAAIKPEHDALLGFYYNGRKWTVSMYHAPGREHWDLSRIAVRHGGGGHAGACGFTTDIFPFPEIQS